MYIEWTLDDKKNAHEEFLTAVSVQRESGLPHLNTSSQSLWMPIWIVILCILKKKIKNPGMIVYDLQFQEPG